MISRILLAADDSPDTLAAARVAIDLAGTRHTRLRVVHVATDHVLDRALESASRRPSVETRRAESAATILARIASMATQAGVEVETSLLSGEVVPAVLDFAREWGADLIIVGKSARSASGEPYVGTHARHLLEFSEQPVLVVPPERSGRPKRPAG